MKNVLPLALAAALFGFSAPVDAKLRMQSVGYIGCSNSRDSVRGYHQTSGNLKYFWPTYNIGGATIQEWANPNSTYWLLYKQMIAQYGQPVVVWVQLCERYSTPANYTQVQTMIHNLKAVSPNAIIYVSAINLYTPLNLCPLMGRNGEGESDTVAWREQLVSSNLVKRGPGSVSGEPGGSSYGLGPLTNRNTLSDLCHPNADGTTLLGEQLKTFFDAL
jgi:hypothetical protein